MVDHVGSKPSIASDLRIATTTRVAAPLEQRTTPRAAGATRTLAAELAAAPPVNGERVAQIKAAVREGRFPISPATIADRLIALRYEWMNDDKA